MVFFTCNACGESIKKIQVEKHVSVCRNCECLSCIDCGKDFWGDDYKSHVKCISEDQKYGGKGYEGKAHKGDMKQQAWMQKINELIKKPNVSPKVRELLEQISAFDNVPRKKAKFQNWMKNSLKVHNESVLDQVWNIFSEASSSEPGPQPASEAEKPRVDVSSKVLASKANGPTEEQEEVKKNKRERKEERQKNRKREKKELKLEKCQENVTGKKPKKRRQGLEVAAETPTTNGLAGKKSKKKKKGLGKWATAQGAGGERAAGEDAHKEAAKAAAGKRKRRPTETEADPKKKMKFPEHTEDGVEDLEAPGKGKFNWKGTIKAVLRQAPDHQLSVKKLKKKVLAQYHMVMNDHHRSEEELLVIFNKKISKNPTFKLVKDKVKLTE
ncbi:cell growth-regulating nucleolar protein isoform X2 [Perognathus longimembris pacificus]|uniref:cell growth-regulating nucleolar protein isoform X2 n=1 Tax=Perognathus longimembris pacificus TaxID=214514 RepID=UPI002018DA7D|nr:cell growth-regulating nucleolar protein isoform X2 [Perognathus longimembris pacificus]